MNRLNRLLIAANDFIASIIDSFFPGTREVWVKGEVANYVAQDSELVIRDLHDGHYISIYIEDFERDMRDEGRPPFAWTSGLECHAKGTPTRVDGKVTSVSDISELVVLSD